MGKRRVYWDACIWFALIKEEAGRYDRCKHLIDEAVAGKVEIWTSTLTLAEVFRKKCGGESASALPEELDLEFESFLAQSFVFEVQVDRQVGVHARRLLRKYSALKKPADAVHLASASWYEVDEFHTFDQANLLSLNGQVATRTGKPLLICEPPVPPPKTPDLFTQQDYEEQALAAQVLAELIQEEGAAATADGPAAVAEPSLSAAASLAQIQDDVAPLPASSQPESTPPATA